MSWKVDGDKVKFTCGGTARCAADGATITRDPNPKCGFPWNPQPSVLAKKCSDKFKENASAIDVAFTIDAEDDLDLNAPPTPQS